MLKIWASVSPFCLLIILGQWLTCIRIALLTISHRPALFKYHRFLLRLTGNNGEWEWETIGTKEQLQSVEKEMASLQEKLNQVDQLKARLIEIDRELALKV